MLKMFSVHESFVQVMAIQDILHFSLQKLAGTICHATLFIIVCYVNDRCLGCFYYFYIPIILPYGELHVDRGRDTLKPVSFLVM